MPTMNRPGLKMWRPPMLPLGLTLTVVMGGCTASRLPDYPTMSVTEYGPHKTADGVTVAIHPVTSATEARKYFGTNLLDSHILPALVVVENQNAQDSYIIRKERIGLVGPEEALDRGKVDRSGGRTAVGVAAGVTIVAAPIEGSDEFAELVESEFKVSEDCNSFAGQRVITKRVNNCTSDPPVCTDIDRFEAVRVGIPTATPTVTPTPHLQDNGDGTITNVSTGLVWEKKDDSGGIHDKDNRYVWAGICSNTFIGFRQKYCQPDAAAKATCEAGTPPGTVGCDTCSSGEGT